VQDQAVSVVGFQGKCDPVVGFYILEDNLFIDESRICCEVVENRFWKSGGGFEFVPLA
jgi:hypothetical protein